MQEIFQRTTHNSIGWEEEEGGGGGDGRGGS